MWASVAIDHGVQGGLARLADEVGADRAYLLPARGDASSGLPEGLLAHVIAHRRPVLLTEAASYRAQRRSNIESASRMLLPVVRDDRVVAVVVCERFAPGGFEAAALETATLAVAAIEPLLTAASSDQPERLRRCTGASRARTGEVVPTAAGAFVADRDRFAIRGREAKRATLCVSGIVVAASLRAAVGAPDTAASMPAGVVFALAILLVAIATGWRPGRPRLGGRRTRRGGRRRAGRRLAALPWLLRYARRDDQCGPCPLDTDRRAGGRRRGDRASRSAVRRRCDPGLATAPRSS